ncbi:hypothetical protein SK128_005343, partial [Halocaridina rubra]
GGMEGGMALLTMTDGFFGGLVGSVSLEGGGSSSGGGGAGEVVSAGAIPVTLTSGNKVYQCPNCQYLSDRKHNLEEHLRIHTGEKPFACPICPYRSTKKGNLKIHVRRHTGEKPYFCPKCPYRASQKVNLMKHSCPYSE